MSNKIQKTKPNKSPTDNKDNLELVAERKSLIAMHKGYQDPIPPPEFMQEYTKIDPSFPDRIIKLTENNLEQQYKHQNKMDTLQFLGWGSATVITLAAMGIGAYLLMNDKDLAGFSLLVGTALPSVIIYFTNRAKQIAEKK